MALSLSVSLPDQPFVPMYTDPMSPSGWGGGYISADGANNCLFSDSVMRFSYVTDTNFHVRDVFCSEYSWYRDHNHIILQGYNCLPKLTSPLLHFSRFLTRICPAKHSRLLLISGFLPVMPGYERWESPI